MSTAAVTRAITRAVVRWAHDRGWSTHTEARVDVATAHDAERLGFVDVIVRRGVPLPDVAIEIDSTNKPWSVVKLRHVAAAGVQAIWVRWGDAEWAGVYPDFDVIQLPVLRRPLIKEPGDQLALWS